MVQYHEKRSPCTCIVANFLFGGELLRDAVTLDYIVIHSCTTRYLLHLFRPPKLRVHAMYIINGDPSAESGPGGTLFLLSSAALTATVQGTPSSTARQLGWCPTYIENCRMWFRRNQSTTRSTAQEVEHCHPLSRLQREEVRGFQ